MHALTNNINKTFEFVNTLKIIATKVYETNQMKFIDQYHMVFFCVSCLVVVFYFNISLCISPHWFESESVKSSPNEEIDIPSNV